MAAKKKAKAKKADIMQGLVDAATKALGPGGIYTPKGKKTRHVGLPLPSLSFEYLLGSNVLWLGASYGLAGPTQSFKSSLAMELMRTVLRLGGRGATVDTEGGKISEVMIDSLLGKLRASHKMLPAVDVEAAQSALSFLIGWFKKTFPKRDALFMAVVDSLFGAAGAEKRKQVEKDGHASRAFPVEALLWSSWLQVNCPGLTKLPFMLFYVNHLKKQIESGNWRHPGGDAQDFYATVYMHVSKVRVHEGTDIAINQLQVKTVKNSFYLPGRRIFVPYVFNKEENRLYFDWGHSTADLLSGELISGKAKDVLGITTTSKSMTALSRTFSCKRLEMKAVTGAELGTAIHADKAIMEELRTALHINMYDIWKGVMPVDADEEEEHEPAELTGATDDSLDIT